MRPNGIAVAAFIGSINRPWRLPSHLMEFFGYDGKQGRPIHREEFTERFAGTLAIGCRNRQRPLVAPCQSNLRATGDLERLSLDLHGHEFCTAGAGPLGVDLRNGDYVSPDQKVRPQQRRILGGASTPLIIRLRSPDTMR
jgi:hypothetical protein